MTIFFLLIIISFGFINKDNLLFYKFYTYNTLSTSKSIYFSVPKIKNKIHIDIYSSNKLCHKYIKLKKINGALYCNSKIIKLAKLNNSKNIESCSYKISFDNNLENCNFNLMIDDPYGNLLKMLLFLIFPMLIIFYLLFKIVWLFIVNFKQKRR